MNGGVIMTLKVVIVDDESATWGVIQKLAHWEKYNMKVIAALNNGKEVLDFIQIHHVDVLITDMNMPSMDGGQLLEILTEQFKDIKTIVVSGYEDFNYLKHAIHAQSIDYLLKPINSLELNKALEKTVIEWKKSKLKKPLSITQNSQALVPVLKDFKRKLFTVIDARDLKQLRLIFKELSKDVNELIERIDTIYAKLHYELMGYLEEQLYRHDLSFADLKLKDQHLLLDSEASAGKMLDGIEEAFQTLLQHLIQFKQENSFLQILDVQQHIDRNYMDQEITLSKIADEFHISKEYLSKAFKERFQVNITEYILQKRMEKAKELMLENGMRIKQAAECVGYEDVSYFYRVWKKFFSIPPGELIKSNKGS